ncbi:MAG: hypothetical protein ACUVQY_07070 [Thermoproteota archaeon]
MHLVARKEILRKSYGGFILPLYWGEEVARRISEKYSVDVIFELCGYRHSSPPHSTQGA